MVVQGQAQGMQQPVPGDRAPTEGIFTLALSLSSTGISTDFSGGRWELLWKSAYVTLPKERGEFLICWQSITTDNKIYSEVRKYTRRLYWFDQKTSCFELLFQLLALFFLFFPFPTNRNKGFWMTTNVSKMTWVLVLWFMLSSLPASQGQISFSLNTSGEVQSLSSLDLKLWEITNRSPFSTHSFQTQTLHKIPLNNEFFFPGVTWACISYVHTYLLIC